MASNKREQNAAQARRRILASSKKSFETRGINVSGVDLLAKESGMAKMTLYKYFSSKDNLIDSYTEEIRRLYFRLCQSLSAETSLKRATQALFDYFIGNEDQELLRTTPLISASTELASHENFNLQKLLDCTDSLRFTLAEKARYEKRSDAEEIASHIVNLLMGSIFNSFLDAHPEPMLQARKLALHLCVIPPID